MNAIYLIILGILVYLFCFQNKVEYFNPDVVKNVKSWTLPVNGPERRRFAAKVKLTPALPYTAPPIITVSSENFSAFAKQLQQMGTTYVTCREEDKVNVMQDIVDRLYAWASANISISGTDVFYFTGILLTLSKVQTDPSMPPVILKLDDIYAWLQRNLKDKINDGTHAACAYLLLGVMMGNSDVITDAVTAWKNLLQNLVPNLADDMTNVNKFLDVSYVINDITLVLYVLHVNNLTLLDNADIQVYHKMINKYATITLEQSNYLSSLYGNKSPAHTLAWIIPYHRMYQWNNVDASNLNFFTNNLATMLQNNGVGYGGSSFWNFAI